MKRLLSLLILVVFVLMLFPLSVFATSAESEGQNYRIQNISNLVCVRYSGELADFPTSFFIPGDSLFGSRHSLSSQQTFMFVVLRHYFDYISTYDQLEEWQEKCISLFGESDIWIAIDELISYYLFYEDCASQVVFSFEFVNVWTEMLHVFNDIAGTSFGKTFEPFDFNSILWDVDADVLKFYFLPSSQSERPDDVRSCYMIVLESSFVEEEAPEDVFSIWFLITDSIDIDILTSWLPPILATPIVTWWGSFILLCVALIALKILHG